LGKCEFKEYALSAFRPVAKVEQQGTYLIVMEKVQGAGWYEIGN